jgi:hypothetical protein
LSVSSLFKDLRRPPGPENILRLLSPRSEALSSNGILRGRALAMRRSLPAPGRPMWLSSFILLIIVMLSTFVKTFFEFSRRHTEKCEQLRGGASFGPANAEAPIGAWPAAFQAPPLSRRLIGGRVHRQLRRIRECSWAPIVAAPYGGAAGRYSRASPGGACARQTQH